MGLHTKTIVVIAGIGLATAGSPLAGQNPPIPARAPRADSLPTLRSGKLIADYLRLLQANGYRRTEAVIAFQRSTGIHDH
jgi:hypothetical protein